jgi:hypothetical protein
VLNDLATAVIATAAEFLSACAGDSKLSWHSLTASPAICFGMGVGGEHTRVHLDGAGPTTSRGLAATPRWLPHASKHRARRFRSGRWRSEGGARPITRWSPDAENLAATNIEQSRLDVALRQVAKRL